MTPRLLLAALVWLAGLAALATAGVIVARYMPGAGLGEVAAGTVGATKLLMLASLLALVAAVVMTSVGLVRRPGATGRSGPGAALLIVAAAGAGAGLSGALWSEMMTKLAASEVGGVRFAVAAPGHAEAALCAALGLLAAAVAITGALLLRRRAARGG